MRVEGDSNLYLRQLEREIGRSEADDKPLSSFQILMKGFVDFVLLVAIASANSMNYGRFSISRKL